MSKARKVLDQLAESEFEKDKKTVLDHLMKAYQITKNMEGDTASGEEVNEILMHAIEEIKAVKEKSY